MLSSWLIKTGIVGLCLLQAAMCADIAIQVGQDMTGQSVLQFYPNTTTAKQGDNLVFHFHSSTHTATGAKGNSAADACSPGTFGEQSVQADGSTYTYPVTTTDPLYFMCLPHCSLGMVMVVNPADQYALGDYVAAATGQPAPAHGSSSSSGGSVSNAVEEKFNKVRRIFLVHMLFMIIGWMLLIPIGALIGRYSRLRYDWVPAHRGVQLSAYLFVFIGFFLAVAGVSTAGGHHFATLHMKLGLALFLLLFVQLLLAQAGRTLNKRRGNRYLSFVHIVTGIVLFALSVWNVHEGFKIWPAINQGPKWQPPRYASYIIYGWTGLIFLLYVGGFALLPKELKRGREGKHIQSESVAREDKPLTQEASS